MKLINELLLKAHATGETKILCHYGFVNNCNLTEGEAGYILDFAQKLDKENAVYILNDICFSAYKTDYNNGFVIAGVIVKKIIK